MMVVTVVKKFSIFTFMSLVEGRWAGHRAEVKEFQMLAYSKQSLLAFYAAVFSVAPPALSPHKRQWGSDTKNVCIGG